MDNQGGTKFINNHPESIVVEVAPSPRSVSYTPEIGQKNSNRLSASIIIGAIGTGVLLLPGLLILVSQESENYAVGTGYYSLLVASCSLSASFFLFFALRNILKQSPWMAKVISRTGIISKRAYRRCERFCEVRGSFSSALTMTFLVVVTSIFMDTVRLDEQGNPILNRSWEYFYVRAIYLMLITAWLVFFKKLIVQRIAIFFHKEFYADRIERNDFMMRNVKRLKGLFASGKISDDIKTDFELEDLSREILKGLILDERRNALNMRDMESALHSDAREFFEMMDTDGNGTLTFEELVQGLKKALEEEILLERALVTNSRVISRLEKVISVLVVIVIFYITISFLMTNLISTVSLLGAGIIAAKFIFADEVSSMFNGIIFVILAHPFDIGDGISIGSNNYLVEDIDLTITTLKGPSNKLTYVSNASLSHEQIGNKRRSGSMSTVYSFSVDSSTTRLQLEEFEAKLNEFIVQYNRDYEGTLCLKNFVLTNSECIEFSVSIKHKSNHQDGLTMHRRNRNFVTYLYEAMRGCEIQLAKFYWDMDKFQ